MLSAAAYLQSWRTGWSMGLEEAGIVYPNKMTAEAPAADTDVMQLTIVLASPLSRQ